jgi:ketosteroid isomerase-like protein
MMVENKQKRSPSMKRTLLVAPIMTAALTIALGSSAIAVQKPIQNRPVQNIPTSNDEEALKKLVHEWAMCTVQGNAQDLEKIMAENFRGNAENISFDKKMLLEALRSGQMKVADWTIEDVKVSVKGNSASATGRSTLTNAKYMGNDFSGKWVWTDRFVKQRDGSWRAVSSQSKRIKQ